MLRRHNARAAAELPALPAKPAIVLPRPHFCWDLSCSHHLVLQRPLRSKATNGPWAALGEGSSTGYTAMTQGSCADTGVACLCPGPPHPASPYSQKSRLAEQQGKVPVLTLGSPHPKRSWPGGAHSAHGAPRSAPYPCSLSLCPPAWTLGSPLMSPTSTSATTERCRTSSPSRW